jgi:IS5 family transposase
MYRREPCHQLSFEDFFLPFDGKLSGANRWVKLHVFDRWDAMEDDCSSQFCRGFGAPAKPFQMALGAQIIKARLGLMDEELVEQIKENPYLQFFIGLKAFRDAAPFDPSMMMYFRKRQPEAVINDCKERIVRHGLAVIQSDSAEQHNDGDKDGGSASSGNQQVLSTDIENCTCTVTIGKATDVNCIGG